MQVALLAPFVRPPEAYTRAGVLRPDSADEANGKLLFRFFVAGDPIGKPAATPVKRGKHVRMISAPSGHRIHDWRAAVRAGGQVVAPYGPYGIAMVAEVVAVFARPKRLLTKKWVDVRLPHEIKPDVDNLEKGIQDSLNGVLWQDDRQLCRIVVEKWYVMPGQIPGIHVHIWAHKSVREENVHIN